MREMTPDYRNLPSPALFFDYDRIVNNLKQAIKIAGNPSRLRLHIKTHKSVEICRLMQELGITKVKCATLAEAEMAAQAGVPDILIAYQLIPSQLKRLGKLMEAYTNIGFSVLLDNKKALQFLIKEFPGGTNPSPGIFLDLNIGQNRCGASAQTLTALAENLRQNGYEPRGLHAYDGHIHDREIGARQEKAAACIRDVEDSLKKLHALEINVPEVVIGGSPTFPVYAEKTPWTLSPGTIALWDYGYGRSFPEMPFEPAAFLLGHIISIPQSGLLTVDLGVKALSCDGEAPPGVIHFADGQILSPEEIEKYQSCGQSEEHWILRSDRPHDIGDPLLAVPRHICTTVCLYDEAFVLKGKTLERWTIHRSRKMKCETEQTK